MPIQAPQWPDYLSCPVCCREFGASPRSPISLSCGHTICRHCLKHLHRKQCPFDQTVIPSEVDELVVNTALLELAGYAPPSQPHHPPCIQALSEHERLAYDIIVRSMEHLAAYLKFCGNAGTYSASGNLLSRPMQRKLLTLLQCCMTDEDGRGRVARATRSLAERCVTELILQHQNPQQLSANLWMEVRSRGCQFLGPAMQEEVLKLVLLALEDGSALSRKVLVMFVVQRLKPHFPQASKTSIGHVVQLLYRASCFKVSKRERASSLMQLKEEYRTYETLRREHDAQIVQVAIESGLRIAPDQWSALLYGDTAHKSHMQSIIDKLQTPQTFAQSVQELFIALHRTGDPVQLVLIGMHLDILAAFDASPDADNPSWPQLAEIMSSLKEVVSGLVHFLQQKAAGRDSNHNHKHAHKESEPTASNSNCSTAPSTSVKYKVAMCRDAVAGSFCPRGNACTFAHSEEELERYRMWGMATQNGSVAYVGVGAVPLPPRFLPPNFLPPPRFPLPPPPHARFPLPPHHHHHHLEYMPTIPVLPPQPTQGVPPENNLERLPASYPAPIIHQTQANINQNGLLMPITDQSYYRISMMPVDENAVQYRNEEYIFPPNVTPMPYLHNQIVATQNALQPIHPTNIRPQPSNYEELSPPIPPGFATVQHWDRRRETWPHTVNNNNNTFNFDAIQNVLPLSHNTATSKEVNNHTFEMAGDLWAVGGELATHRADLSSTHGNNGADEKVLEEELQELKRRIDTDY